MSVDTNTMALLLKKRFPAEKGWLIAREVRNQTGFANRRAVRSADALVAQTWPGSGLHLQGFEFKTTTADFRRELSDLSKSREFSVHCRSWWIVAPKGVVPIEELIPGWGLLECTAKTMRVRVSAAINGSPEPIPSWMWFSIVRAFAEQAPNPAEKKEEDERARAELSRLRKEAIEGGCAKQELQKLKESVAEFEKASGVSVGTHWSARNHGRWFALARELSRTQQQIQHSTTSLESSLSSLLEMLRAVRTDVESIGTPRSREASA